jgi:hypothetical protein
VWIRRFMLFMNPLQIETKVMPAIFQTMDNENSGLNFADLFQTGKYYLEIEIETRHCQQLRDALTAVLDQRRRPIVARDGEEAVRLTVLCTSEDERRRLSSVISDFPSAKLTDVRVCSASGLLLPAGDNKTGERGTEDKLSRLRVRISQLVCDAEVRERLLGDLPTSYELFDEGMLLLPAACLRSLECQKLRKEVLNVICDVFRQVSYKKFLTYFPRFDSFMLWLKENFPYTSFLGIIYICNGKFGNGLVSIVGTEPSFVPLSDTVRRDVVNRGF